MRLVIEVLRTTELTNARQGANRLIKHQFKDDERFPEPRRLPPLRTVALHPAPRRLSAMNPTLPALLVAVAVSRVGEAHRVSDAEGALDSGDATWTIEAEGASDRWPCEVSLGPPEVDGRLGAAFLLLVSGFRQVTPGLRSAVDLASASRAESAGDPTRVAVVRQAPICP